MKTGPPYHHARNVVRMLLCPVAYRGRPAVFCRSPKLFLMIFSEDLF